MNGYARGREMSIWLVLGAVLLAVSGNAAEDPPKPPAKGAAAEAPAPEGLVRLSKTGEVWFDTARNAVVVDGQVCLRQGQLEMFACTKGTKEHESIVTLNCLAEEVHAGLLRAGAKEGKPVSFDPEYRAASGQTIDVYVLWKDEQGEKHQVRAQEWIRNIRTQSAMNYDWVFAGSGFWRDPETGREHYKANGGDLICVSNFPTATLDLPVESSQANDQLLFEAFADRVPPRGTKVRVVLIPRSPKIPASKTP